MRRLASPMIIPTPKDHRLSLIDHIYKPLAIALYPKESKAENTTWRLAEHIFWRSGIHLPPPKHNLPWIMMRASKHVHVFLASLPQPPPPSPIPLSYPRPPLMRRHLFNPKQDRTYRKVSIRELVAHDDIPIPISRVLLQNPRQERELRLYRCPLFLALLRPCHAVVVDADAEMMLHVRG